MRVRAVAPITQDALAQIDSRSDIAARTDRTGEVWPNARKNSDKQNARIEHDKALVRVMTALLKDDTELFKQFMDN